MKKAIALIVMAVLLVNACVFAASEKKEGFTTSRGKVSVGMKKEALYKIYTKSDEKIYFKQGPVEEITFNDWVAGGKITFKLENGKVKSWE